MRPGPGPASETRTAVTPAEAGRRDATASVTAASAPGCGRVRASHVSPTVLTLLVNGPGELRHGVVKELVRGYRARGWGVAQDPGSQSRVHTLSHAACGPGPGRWPVAWEHATCPDGSDEATCP